MRREFRWAEVLFPLPVHAIGHEFRATRAFCDEIKSCPCTPPAACGWIFYASASHQKNPTASDTQENRNAHPENADEPDPQPPGARTAARGGPGHSGRQR